MNATGPWIEGEPPRDGLQYLCEFDWAFAVAAWTEYRESPIYTGWATINGPSFATPIRYAVILSVKYIRLCH